MIGQRLLHYEIIEKLGEGGMGVVYKARDTHLDRFVAIKVLPAEKVADPSRKARFVQEAKAASALNHPNIVTIHDIASGNGRDFIAMEYVAGKTIDQLIPRKGMRLNEALKIAVQIADALAKAHSAGIVHRDLKPSNVIATPDGVVKVLDFGLAKLTEQGFSEDEATATIPVKTDEGTIVGTAAYMSPEQAEGKPVDARSDIFSFGALLYEMLTGQRAFRGDSKLSTLSAILQCEPLPMGDDIPRELQRVVTRCLRKEANRRFHSTIDLKVALEELEEESSSGRLTPERAIAPRRRRGVLWAASAIALLAAAAAVAWLLVPRKSAGPPMRVQQFAALPGWAAMPVLSPDGDKVAFVWNGENQDNFDIYVQLIGSDKPLRLTTDPAADFVPVWSPDGRDLAFVRGTPEGTDVFRIPHMGGSERRIASLRASLSRATPGNERLFGGLAWHPDGKHMAVVDKEEREDIRRLYWLDLETGARTALTDPPKGSREGDGCPAFSPNGRLLSFLRGAGPGSMGLMLQRLSASGNPEGAAEAVMPGQIGVWGSDFTPDGRSLVFSSSRAGEQSLWRVAVAKPGEAPEPERLPVGSDRAYFPSIARRGARLVYSRMEGPLTIWRLPLGASQAAGPASPLVPRAFYPDFSPDGKRLAFTSDRSGTGEIWVSDSDGRNPARLTNFGGAIISTPRWSRDGRRIAFVAGTNDGFRQIFVVEDGGAGLRQLTSGHFQHQSPEWSRGDEFIYFTSKRDGTLAQAWRVPAAGGQPVQVTKNGALYLKLSQDGQYLYYTRVGSQRGIVRMSLESGEETVLLSEEGLYLRWALARGSMYILDIAAEPAPRIRRFDFATGKLSLVANLVPGSKVHLAPTVSPDEKWFLFQQYDRIASDLMLVENFR